MISWFQSLLSSQMRNLCRYSSAVFVHGSKSIFRWQRENWPKKWSWVIDVPHWVLTTVGGACTAVEYQLTLMSLKAPPGFNP